MHFGLTDEQLQLQEAVRGFLGSVPNARDLLEGRGTADDPAIWAQVCEEQAWQAILVPEEQGGFGFGLMDLAVVVEELGRSLNPIPLLPTALATLALRHGTGAARDVALEAIAEGAQAALVLDPANVPGACSARLLVAGDGSVVEAAVEPVATLDVTRPAGRVACSAVEAPADVLAGCEALLAAECVGAAEATLELAVDYAKARQQFGKPIGSFQAIQHKCADMMVLVESARSAAMYACWALDSDAPDARAAAHTAKAMACDALMRCAGENIQIHGGIGFTWEHDAHLYFKRARSSMTLLGSPSSHRAAIADMLLGVA